MERKEEAEDKGGEKGKKGVEDGRRETGKVKKKGSNSQVKEEIVEAFLRDTVMKTNCKRDIRLIRSVLGHFFYTGCYKAHLLRPFGTIINQMNPYI